MSVVLNDEDEDFSLSCWLNPSVKRFEGRVQLIVRVLLSTSTFDYCFVWDESFGLRVQWAT